MTNAKRRHAKHGPRVAMALAAGFFFAGPAREARACGVGAGGASGVSACSLEEHEEQVRLKFRVGAAYAFTSTRLHFGGVHAGQERHGVFATLDYRLTKVTAV